MNSKLNEIVIGIGSNINPKINIKKAKELISTKAKILKISSFIETEPLGVKKQNNFINGSILITTNMNKNDLEFWLRKLEVNLGRIRTPNKHGPRTIDLDILVWNGEVVDGDVYKRSFLRSSMKELLPDLKLP